MHAHGGENIVRSPPLPSSSPASMSAAMRRRWRCGGRQLLQLPGAPHPACRSGIGVDWNAEVAPAQAHTNAIHALVFVGLFITARKRGLAVKSKKANLKKHPR
jgi:hypothetical protein